jgi:hypothetical protein
MDFPGAHNVRRRSQDWEWRRISAHPESAICSRQSSPEGWPRMHMRHQPKHEKRHDPFELPVQARYPACLRVARSICCARW